MSTPSRVQPDSKDQVNSSDASSGIPDTESTTHAAARNRMEPELKAKWVAALRSGEYAQGRGALLNDNDELCCLGVFCRIRGVSDAVLLSEAEQVASDRIPELDAIEPFDAVFATRNALAGMNDDGKSFSEIADWIEANL